MKSYVAIFLFSFFLLLIISSCSSKKGQKSASKSQGKTRNKKDTMERFQTFNVKFHNDSSFQISRVAFPIGGKFVDGTTQHGWSKQNWKMLKNPVGYNIDTTQYKYLLNKTDSSVVEKFWINQSGFNIERRFKLKNNKWYLTFFNDVNL